MPMYGTCLKVGLVDIYMLTNEYAEINIWFIPFMDYKSQRISHSGCNMECIRKWLKQTMPLIKWL